MVPSRSRMRLKHSWDVLAQTNTRNKSSGLSGCRASAAEFFRVLAPVHCIGVRSVKTGNRHDLLRLSGLCARSGSDSSRFHCRSLVHCISDTRRDPPAGGTLMSPYLRNDEKILLHLPDLSISAVIWAAHRHHDDKAVRECWYCYLP